MGFFSSADFFISFPHNVSYLSIQTANECRKTFKLNRVIVTKKNGYNR